MNASVTLEEPDDGSLVVRAVLGREQAGKDDGLNPRHDQTNLAVTVGVQHENRCGGDDRQQRERAERREDDRTDDPQHRGADPPLLSCQPRQKYTEQEDDENVGRVRLDVP